MRDPDQLRVFVERWYQLWNANDKMGWLAHWHAAAPGEPRIEDPVGWPVRRGWGMVEELWDLTGDDHFKVSLGPTLVCGDDVAAVCRSEGIVRDCVFAIDGVDVFQFRDDSLEIHSFWEIPPGPFYGMWTAETRDESADR